MRRGLLLLCFLAFTMYVLSSDEMDDDEYETRYMRACVHACMRAGVQACRRAGVRACTCVQACRRACMHACMCIVYTRACERRYGNMDEEKEDPKEPEEEQDTRSKLARSLEKLVDYYKAMSFAIIPHSTFESKKMHSLLGIASLSALRSL